MQSSLPKIVKREFIKIPVFNDGKFTNFKEITMMHWNILANSLAFGSFDKVPEEYLKWDYRFNLIQQHIKDIDPDVLGMSEVDCFPLYDQIRSSMYEMGYLDYFVEKSSKISGSVIFYKKSKFVCME